MQAFAAPRFAGRAAWPIFDSGDLLSDAARKGRHSEETFTPAKTSTAMDAVEARLSAIPVTDHDRRRALRGLIARKLPTSIALGGSSVKKFWGRAGINEEGTSSPVVTRVRTGRPEDEDFSWSTVSAPTGALDHNKAGCLDRCRLTPQATRDTFYTAPMTRPRYEPLYCSSHDMQ